MMNKSASCFAGFTGLLGGLYLLFDSNSLNRMFEALNTLQNPAAALLLESAFGGMMSLCLVSGALALLTLNSPVTSWQYRLSIASSVVTLLGVVAYLVGSLYVLILLIGHYADFLHHRVYVG